MEPKNNKIEFLAIGDMVIDAFIKLKTADIVGEPDTKDYKICMPFGEKIPFDDVYVINAVGNASNGAVSAARLGLATYFMTNVGDDQEGRDCIATLEKNGVHTDYVKTNPGFKTNYHYVLMYGPERTILIKHQNYPYTFPEIDQPKWIYFSSINETAFPTMHNAIADYVEAHPETKLAFQPGKFEIKLGKEKLARLYTNAELFFCNVEEAAKILETENLDIKTLLTGMRALGPKTVVITDGPKGAYAYDGNEMWFIPCYPDPMPPVSRTGAGDAFASTFTSAIALGKTVPVAHAWGGINSMAVVQHVGANVGLLTREKLEEYIKNAPEDYQVKKIS
jgi:ribokinase